MTRSEPVRVFFDYLCPYAWRGAELAVWIAEPLKLKFEWRHFSVYQSAHQERDGWQLWNDRLEPQSESGGKGLLPFLASCAARRQGQAPFDTFRLALLRARHRDHRPFTLATILEVAKASGLELSRFQHDLNDPECRTEFAHEHCQGLAHDVIATPTFLFEDGLTAHLSIRQLPATRDEAVKLFTDYRYLLEAYPYVEAIKRPRLKCN